MVAARGGAFQAAGRATGQWTEGRGRQQKPGKYWFIVDIYIYTNDNEQIMANSGSCVTGNLTWLIDSGDC